MQELISFPITLQDSQTLFPSQSLLQIWAYVHCQGDSYMCLRCWDTLRLDVTDEMESDSDEHHCGTGHNPVISNDGLGVMRS